MIWKEPLKIIVILINLLYSWAQCRQNKNQYIPVHIVTKSKEASLNNFLRFVLAKSYWALSSSLLHGLKQTDFVLMSKKGFTKIEYFMIPPVGSFACILHDHDSFGHLMKCINIIVMILYQETLKNVWPYNT